MTKSKQKKDTKAGMHEHHRMIILGSGPAGLSAALYAARADLEPMLLTGMELHGQAVPDPYDRKLPRVSGRHWWFTAG